MLKLKSILKTPTSKTPQPLRTRGRRQTDHSRDAEIAFYKGLLYAGLALGSMAGGLITLALLYWGNRL